MGCGLGGWFPGGRVGGLEGEFVSDAFEAADVVAGLAADAGPAFVLVGAEVGVGGGRVRQQGIGDGQEGVAGGDEGLLSGHALDQPPVFRAGKVWVRPALTAASPRAALR